MIRSRRARLLALLLALLLMAGCWSRREIQELAFIMIVGVDWNEEKEEYDITFQMARPGKVPSPGGGGGGGGGGSEEGSFYVTVSARNLAEALRELRHFKSRQTFLGHLQAIVVGDEVARRGLGPTLDFLWREVDVRPSIDVMVARGKAGPMVAAHPALEYLPGRGFPHLMERVSTHSTVPRVTLARLIYAVLQEDLSPMVPLLEVRETIGPGGGTAPSFRDPEIIGSAIFDQDVLVATLDRAESRGVMWARGEVKRTTLIYPDPGRGGEITVLRIRRGGGGISLEPRRSGLPRAKVKVLATGDFLQSGRIPETLSPEMIERLEREAEQVIKREVEAAVAATKAAGSDPIGFGEVLRRSAPEVWQRVRGRWDETYPDLPVTVEARVEIKRTGMLR